MHVFVPHAGMRGLVLFLACTLLIPLAAFQNTSVFDPGEGVSAPIPIFQTDAQYSSEALRARFQGAVQLRLVVDAEGIPQTVEVARKLGLGLDEQAVAAVRQWRFRPGTKDGQPVSVRTRVEFVFRLPEEYGKGAQL